MCLVCYFTLILMLRCGEVIKTLDLMVVKFIYSFFHLFLNRLIFLEVVGAGPIPGLQA